MTSSHSTHLAYMICRACSSLVRALCLAAIVSRERIILASVGLLTLFKVAAAVTGELFAILTGV